MPTASPTRPPLDPAARELLAACHAALEATRARSHLRLAMAGHVCGALAGLLEDAEQAGHRLLRRVDGVGGGSASQGGSPRPDPPAST